MSSSAASETAEPLGSSTQLIIAILKSTNGTIDTHNIAEIMSLPSADAAQKRVKGLFQKLDPTIPYAGTALGTGSNNGSGSAKAPRKRYTIGDNPLVPQTPSKTIKRKAIQEVAHEDDAIEHDVSAIEQMKITTEETPDDDSDQTVRDPATPRNKASPEIPRMPKTPRLKPVRLVLVPRSVKKNIEEDDTDTIGDDIEGSVEE